MSPPALIAVDWGTSSMRATLVAQDGALLAHRAGGPGILAVPAQGFGPALEAVVADWRSRHGALAIVLSGMIGSRQGWAEVPYLPCPAGQAELARAIFRHDAGSLGQVYIVPGLSIDANGRAPDVMRGEETQILGALSATKSGDGTFVLPGTHSKWATVKDGRIVTFATYMTGEVFAALRDHTILSRLMPADHAAINEPAFKQGVAAGAAEGSPGALLQRIFSTRTLGLFDKLSAASLSSYLSGLLIGAEMAAACSGKNRIGHFHIIASAPTLTECYKLAASTLKLEARVAPDDCAARGALGLARAAGLIESLKS
jgi:2-dehydro-3-deoxygalactonokinase